MTTTLQRPRPIADGEAELILAGGCFWGTQAFLSSLPGVRATAAGYVNSRITSPSYAQVCAGLTGAAEAVWVAYDPAELSLWTLLDLWARSIDVTAVNRQGGDVGEQYRSGLYAINAQDIPVLRAAVSEWQEELTKAGSSSRIAVEVAPADTFYLAEDYHQNYLEKQSGTESSAPRQHNAPQTHPDKQSADADTALRTSLTPLQYAVTQNAATELPFDNEYDAHFEPGIYVDITSGKPLFASDDKYNAGCGWPAFSRPLDPHLVSEKEDTSHGRTRTEIRATESDAHLGHVFDDGPAESGGRRYCINSAALRFIPLAEMEAAGYGAWIAHVNRS